MHRDGAKVLPSETENEEKKRIMKNRTLV